MDLIDSIFNNIDKEVENFNPTVSEGATEQSFIMPEQHIGHHICSVKNCTQRVYPANECACFYHTKVLTGLIPVGSFCRSELPEKYTPVIDEEKYKAWKATQ